MNKKSLVTKKLDVGGHKTIGFVPNNWSARLNGDAKRGMFRYSERFPEMSRKMFAKVAAKTIACFEGIKMVPGSTMKVRVNEKSNSLSIVLTGSRRFLIWSHIGELMMQVMDGPEDLKLAVALLNTTVQNKIPLVWKD